MFPDSKGPGDASPLDRSTAGAPPLRDEPVAAKPRGPIGPVRAKVSRESPFATFMANIENGSGRFETGTASPCQAGIAKPWLLGQKARQSERDDLDSKGGSRGSRIISVRPPSGKYYSVDKPNRPGSAPAYDFFAEQKQGVTAGDTPDHAERKVCVDLSVAADAVETLEVTNMPQSGLRFLENGATRLPRLDNFVGSVEGQGGEGSTSDGEGGSSSSEWDDAKLSDDIVRN